ncbi:MAG TPA: biotin--[acetyl-CoA-carboxylase] ligase, partial [Lachnospiraceae bacterium]|nr:biotin--[acetyl-CoA-carboxylase] ligase [Lachnospiraceae bacterium]
VELYDGYLINRNETVRVLDPKGEYTGIAQGINDRGELIVRREDGSIARVYSGEVSVRGVYGYV